MDNIQNDVKAEGTEEVTPEQPSVPEETTEEVTPQPQGDEIPAKDESTEEEVPETGEVPKKGAESRIRELNAEKKAAQAKAQSFAQRLAKVTATPQLPPSYQQPEPGSEISPAQYEADITRKADALVTIRLKQQETINKINSESQEAVRTYPELDPKSDLFDEDLSNVVTKAVEAHVRSNPYDSSVKGFVDELMKPYKRAVTKEVGKASENLAKQVSETALRPNNVKTPSKPVAKTLAEMEAELGIIQA
jgi:hypothetical protein